MLDSEQLEYQRLTREFVAREIAPKADRYDSGDKLANDLIDKIRSLGLINVRVPEAFGGLGLKTVDACVIAEELAFGCSGIASATEVSELAITPVLLFAKGDQQKALLERLTAKTALAGMALDSLKRVPSSLKAVQDGNDFILNGTIDGAVNAHLADWLFLQAEVAREQASSQWIAFCLATDLSGVSVLERYSILGRRAADVSSIRCEQVRIPSNLCLNFGEDRLLLEKMLAIHNAPIVAAGCVGVARAALNQAIDYAKERQTFGKPIAEHQAVAFMLADMARLVEGARTLTLKAAKALDCGDKLAELSFSCRAYAQEMVVKVTTDAVQIFGGYGYTREYPVEKLMRDAMVYQVFYGKQETINCDLGEVVFNSSS